MTQYGKLALGVMLGIAAVLPASAQNNPKVVVESFGLGASARIHGRY